MDLDGPVDDSLSYAASGWIALNQTGAALVEGLHSSPGMSSLR